MRLIKTKPTISAAEIAQKIGITSRAVEKQIDTLKKAGMIRRIGPGMAVFSRYAKVVESSGNAMTVRTALALINQTLDEVLAEQEAEFDADTRWALAWFE